MAKGESIEELTRAIEQTGAVVSGIRAEQAALPTPCPDWDVEELVDHLVHDLQTFTVRARGKEPGGDAPAEARVENRGTQDPPASGTAGSADPADPFVARYEQAADDLLNTWRARGSLDQTVESPLGAIPLSWFVGQNTADILVHGWDLARATGQPFDPDPALADAAAAWGRENLLPERRGDAFAQEVPAPPDAPAVDRLAAVFGRDPSWAPSGGGS